MKKRIFPVLKFTEKLYVWEFLPLGLWRNPASGTTREKGNRSYLNLPQALLAISPPSGTFHRVPEVRSIFFGDETRASLRVLKRQTVHSGDGHTFPKRVDSSCQGSGDDGNCACSEQVRSPENDEGDNRITEREVDGFALRVVCGFTITTSVPVSEAVLPCSSIMCPLSRS